MHYEHEYVFAEVEREFEFSKRIVRSAAWAVLAGAAMEAPKTEDLAFLDSLAHHEDEYVKKELFMTIGRLGKLAAHKDHAVELMLSIEIGDSSTLADELCGAMDYGNMPPSTLSSEQIERIVAKLVPVSNLDEHHIGRFIEWLGSTKPELLFTFISGRLEHDARLDPDSKLGKTYRPIPHHEIGTTFHSLQHSPQYQIYLRNIRDRLLTATAKERWLLSDLFWAIGALDKSTLSVLDEWVHTVDEAKLKVVMDLLTEAIPEVALISPYFAAQLVDGASKVSEQLGKMAVGRFVGNAFKGMYQSAHGEPAPKYVSIRDRSARLRLVFAEGSGGNALFSALRETAEDEIKKELEQDADFDMNRGAL